MFDNDPWHTDFGPTYRWRRFSVPTLLVAAVVLLWLFQHGALLTSLTEWFLEPEGDTTLELPDDLVLARLPATFTWGPDPTSDGVWLALPNEGSPVWELDFVERWTRPWHEGKREPIPPAWRAGGAVPAHFSLTGTVTRDQKLMAVTESGAEQQPQTRIIAQPDGREVARVPTIPAGYNGKGIAWHPTENALVIGSYGSVTLAAGPDWKARTLATAGRNQAEWEALVRQGKEESGYYPNENVTQLLFSADGSLLITAMDRGVRVYDWAEVRDAAGRLPAPRYAVESTLVHNAIGSMKMTFAVAHDARRRLVLWSEYDGKLRCLNLTTGEQGTLLTLTNRYCLPRLQLCAAGDALIADITRMGKSQNGPFVLAVLDYPKVLQRAGIEPAPAADARGKD